MAKDKHSPASQLDMADIGNWKLGHGGKRDNAGRKKGDGSKTMRIPMSLVPAVERLISEYKEKKKS